MTTFRALAMISLISLIATPVFAVRGGSDGGGGKVILCPKGGEEPELQLLDFSRAYEDWGLHIDRAGMDAQEKAGMNIYEIFNDRLAAIRKVDVGLATKLAEEAKYLLPPSDTYPNPNFEALVRFTNSDIKDPKDSNEIAVPADCKVAMVILQKPLLSDDYSAPYLINRPLWNRMIAERPAQLVGLIFHETMLREYKGIAVKWEWSEGKLVNKPNPDNGLPSDDVQHLNAYLHSTNFGKLEDMPRYERVLTKAKTHMGRLDLGKLPDGKTTLQGYTVGAYSTVNKRYTSFVASSSSNESVNHVYLFGKLRRFAGPTRLYETGELRTLSIGGDRSIEVTGYHDLIPIDYNNGYQNKYVKYTFSLIDTALDGQPVSIEAGIPITLYPNGRVKSAAIYSAASLKSAGSKSRLLKNISKKCVTFDESGLVTSVVKLKTPNYGFGFRCDEKGK